MMGMFDTHQGRLKLAQVIVGAVCVCIASHYLKALHGVPGVSLLIFGTVYFTGTLLSFISTISGITPNTGNDVLFHGAAAFFLFVASVWLLIRLKEPIEKENIKFSAATIIDKYGYLDLDQLDKLIKGLRAAAAFGIINSVLYGVSVALTCF